MRKIVLTFGLIAGGVLALMMWITFPFHDAIGFDKSAVVGYTAMVVAFLLVFFGIRAYRDSVGGSVSFGRAFSVGMLIVAVASACYVVSWEVMYNTVGSDYIAKYQAHLMDKARAGGATEAELAQKTTELQRFAELYKNPAVNVALTFLEPLPVGFIIALVSAGILSRRRRASQMVAA